jgi:two-component system CheB/CheR fusion protein
MRDITSEIVSFDIYAAAADTLATLTRKDVEVAARGGKWYAVRIMPYRTVDFTIDGVVLTFSEVTALKKALEGFESVESLADGIVKSIRSPFLVLDGELRVHAANDPFYAFFRVIPRETIGKPIQTLGSGQWNIPVLKRALEEILEKNKGLEDFVVEYDFPQIGRKKVLLNGKRIEGSKFVYLSVEEAAEKRP